MPYKVKKIDGYGVQNIETGKWKSRGTSLEKAKSQRRLLYGVEHGWKPTGKLAAYKRLKKRRRKK